MKNNLSEKISFWEETLPDAPQGSMEHLREASLHLAYPETIFDFLTIFLLCQTTLEFKHVRITILKKS